MHLCENDRGAPGLGQCRGGSGSTPVATIGFRGPFVIESFTSKVKSIACAAAIWRPLADSQDELAQSGLRFLRTLLS